jgi:hypothetical protein
MESFVNSPAAREALGLTRSRCTSKAKSTGEQCGRPAILGGFVCPLHGGMTPIVRDAAKQRLLELADPAIYALRMVVVDLTGEWERAVTLDDAPRVAHFMSLAPSIVRAAQVVLDRAGFSPAMKVEVSAPNPFEGLSPAELADRAEEFAREARAVADRHAQMQIPDGSVDGEVIK